MGFFDGLFDNAGVTLQSVAKNSFKFKTIIYIIGTVIGAIYFFADYEPGIAFSIIVACVLIVSTDYLITVALVGLGKIVENAERQLDVSAYIEKDAHTVKNEATKNTRKILYGNLPKTKTSTYKQKGFKDFEADRKREILIASLMVGIIVAVIVCVVLS